MTTRPYTLKQRKANADETRARIIVAARDLLADTERGDFTVDAITRRAGVSRMTIYHQFGSKSGVLEAVCDALAQAGGMGNLAGAFGQADPHAALDEYIATFGRFWEADRPVTRRLHALGVLDPEIAVILAARDGRRVTGLGILIGRLIGGGELPAAAREETIALLHALTSFSFFDQLAGDEPIIAATPRIQHLARLVIDGASARTAP